MSSVAVWERIRAWLWRYGPAELLGSAAALLGALFATRGGGGELGAAAAANWAEFFAYYGLIIARDVRALERLTPQGVRRTVRDLVLEFGPAELLNILVRNATLYLGIVALPSLALGVLAGKLVADVLFYLPAIVSYELLRRPARSQGAAATPAPVIQPHGGGER